MQNSISEAVKAIRANAEAEGFDVVRFAKAEAAPEAADRLNTFVAEGRYGTMDWNTLWDASVTAGSQLMILEHDQPSDWKRTARRSIETMRRLGGSAHR